MGFNCFICCRKTLSRLTAPGLCCYAIDCGLLLSRLTWTAQPSHVHLCLRVLCVCSDWSREVVTCVLHNLHGVVDASAAADTREAAKSDPLFGFYAPNKTCLVHVWAGLRTRQSTAQRQDVPPFIHFFFCVKIMSFKNRIFGLI